MGLADIIKPMSTVLSSGVKKSQQHLDKDSCERRELNPGLLGEKQICYMLYAAPKLIQMFIR